MTNDLRELVEAMEPNPTDNAPPGPDFNLLAWETDGGATRLDPPSNDPRARDIISSGPSWGFMATADDPTTVRAFWNAQAEWSNATFGPESVRGPVGPLKHLEKEAREAVDETDAARRKVEIADCQFLVFDAARRAGMTFEELFETCWSKLAINRRRSWQKPTSDGPVEHVRPERGAP